MKSGISMKYGLNDVFRKKAFTLSVADEVTRLDIDSEWTQSVIKGKLTAARTHADDYLSTVGQPPIAADELSRYSDDQWERFNRAPPSGVTTEQTRLQQAQGQYYFEYASVVGTAVTRDAYLNSTPVPDWRPILTDELVGTRQRADSPTGTQRC